LHPQPGASLQKEAFLGGSIVGGQLVVRTFPLECTLQHKVLAYGTPTYERTEAENKASYHYKENQYPNRQEALNKFAPKKCHSHDNGFSAQRLAMFGQNETFIVPAEWIDS
jgi:hypothetical protein